MITYLLGRRVRVVSYGYEKEDCDWLQNTKKRFAFFSSLGDMYNSMSEQLSYYGDNRVESSLSKRGSRRCRRCRRCRGRIERDRRRHREVNELCYLLL